MLALVAIFLGEVPVPQVILLLIATHLLEHQVTVVTVMVMAFVVRLAELIQALAVAMVEVLAVAEAVVVLEGIQAMEVRVGIMELLDLEAVVAVVEDIVLAVVLAAEELDCMDKALMVLAHLIVLPCLFLAEVVDQVEVLVVT
jgi:hypothetical protein